MCGMSLGLISSQQAARLPYACHKYGSGARSDDSLSWRRLRSFLYFPCQPSPARITLNSTTALPPLTARGAQSQHLRCRCPS